MKLLSIERLAAVFAVWFDKNTEWLNSIEFFKSYLIICFCKEEFQ